MAETYERSPAATSSSRPADEEPSKCTRLASTSLALPKTEIKQMDESNGADLKLTQPEQIDDFGGRVPRGHTNWQANDSNSYLDETGGSGSRLRPAHYDGAFGMETGDRYVPADQLDRDEACTPCETKYCPPPPQPQQPPMTPYNYNYNYPRTPAAASSSALNHRLMPAPAPAQTHSPFAGAYPQRTGRLHGHGHVSAYQTAINQRPTYNPAAYPQHFPNMWYPNASYGYGGGGGGPGYGGSYGPNYGGGGIQRPHQHYNHHQDRYGHDPMIDMLQMSNSGREARNRAEKNRRDKLNGSIQELSTLVPHVAESPKRVDKTAVLRFAAHGLRLQHVFGQTCTQESRTMQVSDALMKLLDSFFITLTCHGQIVLISRSVEQHLGHCQSDLYGQNILHITHPEDHNMIKQLLIPTDLDTLFDGQGIGMEESPRIRTKDEEDYIDQRLREDKRSFTVRLARAGPRSEPTTYEVVKIDGIFRRSDGAPRGLRTNTFPSTLQLIRRTRRDDTVPLHTISGNDIVLVAIARIIRPPKIINSSLESNSLEYKTRHLIDGRIVDCEQRIGIVAGYMADEIRNLSPFTFIHQDDVRWVIVALRQMYDCNSSYGESTYRLLTRNGNFIYLQTKGYLEIDKATNQVHSFVCMNTLLDEAEGRRRVQEMKNKFSVIIDGKIPNSPYDAPASEDPQQLERAVLCLIENLQKSPSDDEDDACCGGMGGGRVSVGNAPETATIEEIHCNGLADNYMNSGGSSGDAGKRANSHCASATSARSAKTPPLALVPPEPASVKSSISKSVSVVNVTAAKHLRDNQQRGKSPLTHTSSNNNNNNNNNIQKDNSPNSLSVGDVCSDGEAPEICSPIKRKRQFMDYGNPNSAAGERNAKRRLDTTEIEDALSNSLNQIGRSLDEQRLATMKLLDESSKYEVPNSNQRIDDLIVEHQKQNEMFVNIKSEYNEIQMQNCNNNDNTTNTTTTHHQSIANTSDPWVDDDGDSDDNADDDDNDDDDDDGEAHHDHIEYDNDLT